MTNTPDLTPEAVERLARHTEKACKCEFDGIDVSATLRALSAALEVAEMSAKHWHARAEAAEARERALLKSNDQERKVLVENASLRHRLKTAEAERDALKAELAEAVGVLQYVADEDDAVIYRNEAANALTRVATKVRDFLARQNEADT